MSAPSREPTRMPTHERSLRRKSPLERQMTSTGTVKESPQNYFKAALFGIHSEIGNKEAQVAEWQNLSVITALLLGVASGGMFACSSLLTQIAQESQEAANAEADFGNGTAATGSKHVTFISGNFFNGNVEMQAKFTMWLFCIDTFFFLTATALCVFYVAFTARSKYRELWEVHRVLGIFFHAPQVYFRFGYYLMVLSLVLFFDMVMSVFEVMGCLSFCILTAIAPMIMGMTKAMSTFADPTVVGKQVGTARHLFDYLTGEDVAFYKKERDKWAEPIVVLGDSDQIMRLQRACLSLEMLKDILHDTALMNTILKEAGIEPVGARLKIIGTLKGYNNTEKALDKSDGFQSLGERSLGERSVGFTA